jgi:hypothetical protein
VVLQDLFNYIFFIFEKIGYNIRPEDFINVLSRFIIEFVNIIDNITYDLPDPTLSAITLYLF